MPASRRVLIVAPHFAPTNAADSHRVRTALPYLRAHGWEPVVLAVDPRDVAPAADPWLAQTVPADAEVRRVRAWPARLTRLVGVGSLAFRARRALRDAGDRLLAAQRFDAVFFSTTEFPLLTLGLRWRETFGVPFVADWQDPWINHHYERTGQPPPGGRVKFAVSQWLAARNEPAVVRGAAQIVAVSRGYLDELAARYPDWNPARGTVLPFGAPVRDFELLGQLGVAPAPLPVPPDAEVWLSAGRGGSDLHRAARGLFAAVAADRAAAPDRWARRRLVFLGTSYAAGARARPTLAPLAAACDVGDLVVEVPERAPYFATLAALRAASRLLLLGSDDANYTASKAFPYALAGRPVLAVLHERSGAAKFLRACATARVAVFTGDTPADELAAAVRATGGFADVSSAPPTPDAAALAPHTAEAMTARLAAVFEAVAFPARA